MKYFSMFSGVGGFENGIEKATDGNWECIGYSEIDKYAIQVYKKHYPNHINYGDCTKINPKKLPDFDLLVGGVPCQSWSIAGKRKGFDDPRGSMWFEVFRILKVKQPQYILLENVKGLLSHNKGKSFKALLKHLNSLGYYIDYRILNSKYFGVPQNRERVFIFGVNIKCLKEFAEDGQKGKIILLEKIIKPYLLEILLKIYKGVKKPQELELKDLDLNSIILKETISSGIVKKYPYLKIILQKLIPNWQECLQIEPQLQSVTKKENWELKDPIGISLLTDISQEQMEKMEENTNIEKLLKKSWEENLNHPKEFITSMVKKMIIDEKIYTYAEIKVITNLFIVVWKELLMNWWKKVSLNLIKKKVNMNDKDMQFFMGNKEEKERAFIIGYLRGKPRPEILPFGDSNKETSIQQQVSSTIHGGYYKMGGREQQYINESKIIQLNSPKHSNDRIYNPDGISPSLNTAQGGRRQPKIKINSATKKGYSDAEPGDGIRLEYPESKTARGRVIKGNSNTLKKGTEGVITSDLKIRRLTPTECERLQGFSDDYTKEGVNEKGEIVQISDSQRYKMCGNAVTTNVIKAIIKKMKEVK